MVYRVFLILTHILINYLYSELHYAARIIIESLLSVYIKYIIYKMLSVISSRNCKTLSSLGRD